MYKKRDARARLLFCFFPFSLPLPSSLRKLPDTSLHVKERMIRIPDSGIREIFVCDGTQNTAQGIYNPTKDWNPDFKFH